MIGKGYSLEADLEQKIKELEKQLKQSKLRESAYREAANIIGHSCRIKKCKCRNEIEDMANKIMNNLLQ